MKSLVETFRWDDIWFKTKFLNSYPSWIDDMVRMDVMLSIRAKVEKNAGGEISIGGQL